VDAAVNGLRSLSDRGLVLADEVGLGKTIEAGLILAQLVAEGKRRILVLAPASLRKQWVLELDEKLGIHAEVVDGNVDRLDRKSDVVRGSVFDRPGVVVVASHPFAARRADQVRALPWDVVIIDEAHRLRGAHKGSKTAEALRDALEGRPKLLLTATPLQNGLDELYGLMTYLDPELLGPYEDFRRAFPGQIEPDSVSALRERVKPLIHRTLRRQVREYVRYTERKSTVCHFSPTAEEMRLYDEVSEYLADEDTWAIAPNRRALMVMVYRKLLASSPQAIAHTLHRLASGLEERLERGEFDDDFDSDERELIQTIQEDLGHLETEAAPKPTRAPPTPGGLRREIGRLRELAELASSIQRPAKTEALLTAIDRAFTEAVSRGWPRKAVVFTESRRTQDALVAALEATGHAGQVLTLNGNSGGAEERGEIVRRFRDEARILIMTEAGAEGLNLQFANVIVNYDLPWNPQRIEQRIGRCHRYGQTRDVVVLNFLSQENAAESRLYELLEKKLSLFDGVFGATDEPLGALGDGDEFEKRVHEIFGNCRDPETIRSAFDAFQAELSDQIAAGMARARAQLFDHFDDEIRNRLKMTGQRASAALDEDEAALVALVKGGVPGAHLDAEGKLHLPASRGGGVLRTSHKERGRGADFLTLDHPLAAGLIDDLRGDAGTDVRYVLFDYTGGQHKISRLAPLLGSEGWWLVYKLSFDGSIGEDHLVHVVVAKTPEGESLIFDDEQVKALMNVTCRDIPRRSRMRAATLASTLGEAALEPRIATLSADGRARADRALRDARELVERSFDDRLDALGLRTRQARDGWKKAREKGDADAIERAFRELRRAMDREHDGRGRAAEVRKRRLAELDARNSLGVTRTLVGTAYFWLE
jgi:superfamily II DNA or RNA helicase